jgi:flagellar assembly protein FliH
MATFRKFTFDLSFDEARRQPIVEETAEEDVAEAPVEEAPPPPPTFTEEELTLARDQALQEGRAAGKLEAEQATERMAATALTAISEHLAGLFATVEASNDATARNAVRVAMAVAAKMLPAAARRHAISEIELVVTECVPHVLDQPRVILRVAEELAPQIREPAETAAKAAGFEGRVLVTPDARIPVGDCRVEWTDGGADRTQDKIWEAIEETVGRMLEAQETHTAGVHDSVTPAQ